jgi:ligand-binding sensor domain-containing protein/signal transduction histidine kinase
LKFSLQQVILINAPKNFVPRLDVSIRSFFVAWGKSIFMKAGLLLLCLLLILSTDAQQPTVFHRITTKEGLTSDFISCIRQDDRGFLWVGTPHGLNRFDGTHVKQFVHHPNDSTSLRNNAIIGLYKEPGGILWVSTYYGGINIYNDKTNSFHPYTPTHHVSASGFAHLLPLDGNTVLVPQGSLCFLNLATAAAQELAMPVNSWSTRLGEDSVFECGGLLKDEQQLWLIGSLGLVRYNLQTKTFDLLCKQKKVPSTLKNENTWDIARDSTHNIWIGSGSGLFEYSKNDGTIKTIYPNHQKDAGGVWVKCLLCDVDGSVWFGTDNGLFHYFPQTDRYEVFKNSPTDNASISDNSINCLYKDAQGILWIGTENGLNALYPIRPFFTTYQSDPFRNSLPSNSVAGMHQDSAGNLWMSSGPFLSQIEAKSGAVHDFQFWDKRTTALHEFNYRNVLFQDGLLWLGTWSDGVQVFNPDRKKFVASFSHDDQDSSTLCSNYINDLCLDRQGNLWIASWNGGIDAYNGMTKKFTHYNAANKASGVHSNYAHCIYCDDEGTIWAGVIGGLQKFNPQQNKFEWYTITKNPTDYSHASPLCIVKGLDRKLWIGTPTGLVQFDPVTRDYREVSAVDGAVQGILQDEKTSDLWLASEQGLVRYNPALNHLKKYTLEDGLPSLVFNHYSYKSKDGTFFFATHHGLVRFNPQTFQLNTLKPSVYLTSFKINNQEYTTAGNISDLQTLTLTHVQNYLTFEFAALNFMDASLNQYQYQLSGIDTGWINSNGRTEVTYTSLPPGTYVFKVRASNNHGVWNETPAMLTIHIQPAWYQTGWFYASCLVGLVLVLYAFYRIRINQLLKVQAIRNRIASDLHDEIGSTLSSIRIMSDTAQKKLQTGIGDVQSSLQKISAHSAKVQESMSDIVWTLHAQNDTVQNIIVRLRVYAAEIFEAKDIALHFHADDFSSKLLLDMDKRKSLYLIVKEAINNAAKYANCTECTIKVVNEHSWLHVLVSDNGHGFHVDKKHNGNGINNMKQRAKESDAQLHIHSAPGRGTTIDLKLRTT